MVNSDETSCQRAAQTAAAMFESGFYCAESVLLALAEENNKTTKDLSRLMTGMCAGLCRSGGPCGALLGAMAAFGLLFGRDKQADPKDTVYALGYHMTQKFEQEFGSTLCSGVLGCDISTVEGAAIFTEKNLGTTRCQEVTAKAAFLAQELIDSHETLVHPILET